MNRLNEACLENDLDRVNQLIAEGVNVNGIDDNFGCTALQVAVSTGHIECVTALLDAKADVNASNSYLETALHLALLKSREDCIRLLIQRNANVNALNPMGSSPLHYACYAKKLVCLKILIANGAEIDEPNQEGNTPLVTCFMRGHCLEIAEFLLHSGAKMSNVSSWITVPNWMNLVIEKRHSVMNTTLTLKGVLKRRLGIYKDVTHLIALYVWNKRVSK